MEAEAGVQRNEGYTLNSLDDLGSWTFLEEG